MFSLVRAMVNTIECYCKEVAPALSVAECARSRSGRGAVWHDVRPSEAARSSPTIAAGSRGPGHRGRPRRGGHPHPADPCVPGHGVDNRRLGERRSSSGRRSSQWSPTLGSWPSAALPGQMTRIRSAHATGGFVRQVRLDSTTGTGRYSFGHGEHVPVGDRVLVKRPHRGEHSLHEPPAADSFLRDSGRHGQPGSTRSSKSAPFSGSASSNAAPRPPTRPSQRASRTGSGVPGGASVSTHGVPSSRSAAATQW